MATKGQKAHHWDVQGSLFRAAIKILLEAKEADQKRRADASGGQPFSLPITDGQVHPQPKPLDGVESALENLLNEAGVSADGQPGPAPGTAGTAVDEEEAQEEESDKEGENGPPKPKGPNAEDSEHFEYEIARWPRGSSNAVAAAAAAAAATGGEGQPAQPAPEQHEQ